MVVRLSRRLRDEEEGRAITRGVANGESLRNSVGASSIAVWKTLSIFLLVLLILIITETIELKMPSHRNKGDQVSLQGIVQMKSKTSSSSSFAVDNNENMVMHQLPEHEELTKPPTEAPQPKPANLPTQAPQTETAEVKVHPTSNAPSLEAVLNQEPADPPEEAQKEEPGSETQQSATPADLTSSRKTERHTYQRRGQPMSDQARKEMIEKWGQWTLIDNKERPSTDYYVAYPNRDIPRSAFPPNAWQVDTEYLSKFLPEAIKLVDRALEAILAEYGKTEGSFKERAEMFELEMFDTLEKAGNYIITKPEWRKDETGERGGWSTYKSLKGLQRRLLHAVMTEDTFVFALGGHSAAAGHGNLFVQSYSVQVQWILEAIFARLRVRHQSKNFANGGLGTIQVRDSVTPVQNTN
jgi:hypothetical protein